MSWEARDSQRYYYRRRKVGGQVVAEYIGAGPTAALIARLDTIEREEREEERRELRQAQAEQDALDRQIDEMSAYLQDLVSATLIVAGYHRHKRQWRKKRNERAGRQSSDPEG